MWGSGKKESSNEAAIQYHQLGGSRMTIRTKPVAINSILVILLAILLYPTNPATAQSSLAKPVLTAQVDGTTVEFNWEPVEGAARYEMWRWQENVGWTQLDDGNLTATSYTDTGLAVGIRYFWTGRTVDSDGDKSGWADYFEATIATGASSDPTSTPVPTQAAGSGPTPYPTYTPYPTSTPVSCPAISLGDTFPPGTHLVGIDLGPGTYRGDASDSSCYWERLSCLDGSFECTIANDFIGSGDGIFYVTVKSSDKALTVNRCTLTLTDIQD